MVNQVKSSQSSSSGFDTEAIINIDAQTNDKKNPVVQVFKSGTYEVRFIGQSEGGRYDAWSPWGAILNCDEKGENCEWGWVNQYNLLSSEFTINIPSSGKYSTPEQALAKAQNTSFSLILDGQVNFFIDDDILQDNRGGVSLAVKKVREAPGYPQYKGGSFVLIVIIILTFLVIWFLVNLVSFPPTISK